jgi:D-alanyl-D-alanine carboxypeptidase (penicillin-binding protein 5/6)
MFSKIKLIFAFILICSYLNFMAVNLAIAASIDPTSITAQSYVLMDADSGKVLLSRHAHQHLPPASLTKLMTILLTLEALAQGKAHKDDRVITSKKAASMEGTRIYLEQGEIMRLDDLLKSMALASANDASVAMAEKLSGSEAKFVVQMNAKAKAIGMKDSRFKNVSGMPASGHYSSAYDMAVLARYTLANTPILNYSSLKQYTLRGGKFPIYNGNKLLWRYKGADGLKNGYTSNAKNCLIATAQRDKLRLIVVVMGCPLKGSQTSDSITLLDYGFEHYAAADLLPRNQVCGTVKVKTGTAKEVAAVLPDGLNTIYLKREGIHFTRRQELVKTIKAPVKRGQKLGEMQILANGKLLKQVDLTAASDVGRLSLPGRIIQMHWILKLLILLVGALFYARHRIRKNGGHWRKVKRQTQFRSARSQRL